MRSGYTIGFILIILSGLATRLYSQADTTGAVISVELGEVRITAREKDIGSEQMDRSRMQEFNQDDAAGALNLIPGVNFVNLGPKNEAMITVRGFDIRQVPVYLDGVPVYTPYEGYIDLGRFLLQDLAKISVSKGVSSVLYGPNTMGGAINLVSRKPEARFEFDGVTGVKTGRSGYEGYRSGLNIGGRYDKVYYQLSYSLVDYDSFGLSRDHDTGDGDPLRDNSQRMDLKLNAKAGFTPNKTDEYAVNFIHQHAAKGVPVYTGEDPNQRVRYWRFPAVDKQGINFLSKTVTGGKTYLRTRLYYDRYYSDLRSYDDASYSSQDRPSSFTSIYLDDSFGGSLSLDYAPAARHDLKGVFHYKYDHHREHNSYPVEESVRHFRDRIISLGLEDNYTPLQKLLIIGGISYNASRTLQADDYDATSDSIYPFPENGSAALNAQMGIEYNLTGRQDLRFSLARKTRFATMKDRYSYRLGRSLPNPTLKAESGLHADLSHILMVGGQLRMTTSLFFSRLDDVMQPVYGVDPDNSAVYQFRNTGRADFYGFESDVVIKPVRYLEGGLQYNRIERKNLSMPDVYFTDVPRHRVFGYLRLAVEDRFYIMYTGDFNSERISTSNGEYTSPAFFLSNIKGSIHIWKFVHIDAGIMNLLDTDYSYLEGYPEEGRNYFLSLRFESG
jgi:iron complex outermembrane receptor protein